jgi:pimeloyl-ACP methyl ester carboxylesterase
MARLWLPVAARLQPYFRVLAPDLPGHGASADREPGLAPAVDAITAWVGAMAPDAAAVVGNGATGGAIAAAVAADATVPAVVFGPAEGEEWPAEPAPLEVREWTNYWDLFFDLRISKPYSTWRPDVFWWLVEHGVVETADAVRLRVRMETEQALRSEAKPVGPYHGLAAAPFTRPHVAAKQLRELLQGLA